MTERNSDEAGPGRPSDGDYSVTVVDTQTDWEAVVALRMAVFVDEQGVPEELELDEHDADPLESSVDHLLVRDAGRDDADGDDADGGNADDDNRDGDDPPGDPVAVARLRAVDAEEYAGGGDYGDGGTSVGDAEDRAGDDEYRAGDAASDDGDGRVAKIERVAVARERRGEGWGARVMRAAEARARDRDLSAVVLHAQTRAAGFYEGLGYAVDDGVGTFDEDGIEHVRMRRTL
ncbi:GNAT family N-acetyltransferase [Halobaculum sp. CBA1158]|uniref:GNAT family N-acetyltransferase n=1 Tax=Halobaculum sp. CBA1158 TaxID=2904243 RepID=UPI001F48F2B3|nr:GNAT family N-acetyltransferase [Halobaculum sp. CBA1158]UIO98692.1 GNAT family N-acetyltransferase [Halobaculum sp. CBA1158]